MPAISSNRQQPKGAGDTPQRLRMARTGMMPLRDTGAGYSKDGSQDTRIAALIIYLPDSDTPRL
jgi:hypothetical protein